MLIYILLGIVCILLVILIIGLLLPKTRTLTKQTVYGVSAEKVYNTVTNNQDWKYRTSLNDLKIIQTNGDMEVWEETSGGNTIRFRTKEKKPYTFYSFEMESKLVKGYWYAEFKEVEKNKTFFSAT